MVEFDGRLFDCGEIAYFDVDFSFFPRLEIVLSICERRVVSYFLEKP